MGRGTQIDMDTEAMQRLWTEQRGTCPVTGLQMACPRERRHPCVATPTRTGPDGTVCLVCYFVAVLLRSFSLLEVRQLLHVAAERSREMLKARAEGQPLVAAAPAPAIPRDIERQLCRALNNSQRRAASRKKLRRIADPHSLTIADLRDMWVAQSGRCAITGVQLTARRGEAPAASMLTIDRVNSSLGYSVSNCQLLSFATNLCKVRLRRGLNQTCIECHVPVPCLQSDLSQDSFLCMLADIKV